MSLISSLTLAFGLITLGTRTVLAQDYPTCLCYGMDFQNGNSYFQNSLSTQNFTSVTQFESCQNDIAYNILINPNGDQTLCSNTNLQPDDTNQLSTCPIQKNQLYSGDWSIVIISNNGAGDPIAYERDFSLSVGPQSTVTYTPTVTVTSVYQPVFTQTNTSVQTITTVLDPSTVTSPSTTITPTKTVTPPSVLSTSTKVLTTIKLTSHSVHIAPTTQTKTASCKAPTRQNYRDPTATIRVTVGPAATIISQKFRREVNEEKARFIAARAARLAARAPDPQPLTVTDLNTSDYPTATTTSTAPTITATVISTTLTTFTSTPPPVTVITGQATAKVVTITVPAKTVVITKWTLTTSVTTKVTDYVITVTTTTTPSAVATACKKIGGILV